MFLIDFALFLGGGFICVGLATNVVEILPTYSSTYITLKCTVREVNARFMIHLTCPFMKIGFCYSNCKASCKFDENNVCEKNSKIRAISHCDLDTSKGNQMSTTYKISTRLLNETGDWRCSFKNHKSDSISLGKYEHLTNPQSLTEQHISTRIVTDSAENKGNTVLSVNIHSFTKDSSKAPVKVWEVESRIVTQYLTRVEIVLLMLIIFGFSLILNLSFLVRCILLKSVVDKYQRGIPINSCTLSCLCIDHYARLRRYSKGFNFSNQTGSDLYRCQPMLTENLAIYDDLSAISNNSGRLKLRLNNSDIDDETRLINLMPNVGCHVNSTGTTSLSGRYTNQSHATYFHSGLGNYVIVGGPLGNPDQYTIETSTPVYPLQIISPISTMPGSPSNRSGSHIFVQSVNHDVVTEPVKNQTANMIHNQQIKTNALHTDYRDSNQLIDLSYSGKVTVNCCNPNCQTSNNYNSQNGLTALYPYLMNNVPTSSSTSTVNFS